MTIVVIGHLCLDVIHQTDQTETQSYGGIFFSVAALANLLAEEGDSVLPVFGVGKTDYDPFIERLRQYPNVDTSGIYKFNAPTNQVDLLYSTSSKRRERSRFIAEPIQWKKVRQHLDGADMVLVNMISGFDITLETLDEIRIKVRDDHTPVYMDVHSLTLGIDEDFVRFHRPVEAWRRWLFMLHAVQMNEEEAAILTLESLDEPALAKHVLALNTKAMHITRGDRGSTLFVDIRKQIQRVDIPAVEPEKAVDPTGCGDVFAAAYCAYYMKNEDITGATQFANRVASSNAQRSGSTAIDTLSTFRIQEGDSV
jgi:sugar/nucleoside kinase (ribokinase family)